MRGPKPFYPIELSPEQEQQLRQLVRAHTTPQTIVLRARIVLAATTIPSGVTSRLPLTLALLIVSCASGAAATQKPSRLTMRRGRVRRGVFPPEVQAQVTATACSLPRTQAAPLARWSRAELARRVAAACSVARLSASTVGRWLRAERIRPWR